MKRRNMLKYSLLTGPFIVTQPDLILKAIPENFSTSLKGNINHSVCRWCYSDYDLEDLAAVSAKLGLKSVELLDADEWPIVQKYGLTCAIGNGSSLGITKGFNDPINHNKLLKEFSELIPKASEFGINKLICFSGNRNGMSDEVGLKNCIKGLKPILALAKENGIQIVMELLNSKVDHLDYQCDHTRWGVELCKKLNHPNFGLLYDIYHMQIMEGDVIRTIQTYSDYIFHYHTGGVPGRNEINDSQELNYTAIMKAIVASGYTGYVGQEFIPKSEHPFKSLAEGIIICDI